MEYLHQELHLESGDVVEVSLDHPANVMLLDKTNFQLYFDRKPFRCIGGYVRHSPYRITCPSSGAWYVVVDLGGGPGHVRASVAVLPSKAIA